MTAPASKQNHRRELAEQADALLKAARLDPMTGAKKDRAYHRNKRAEQAARPAPARQAQAARDARSRLISENRHDRRRRESGAKLLTRP